MFMDAEMCWSATDVVLSHISRLPSSLSDVPCDISDVCATEMHIYLKQNEDFFTQGHDTLYLWR